MAHKKKLTVVSNRLPVVLSRGRDGWDVESGTGGLVTALAPVLRDRGGTWIGWPGTSEGGDIEGALSSLAGDIGYSLVPVGLSAEEVERHYRGFSNEIIWPLFHDLQSHCNFDPSYWDAYKRVNRRFAEVILRTAGDDAFVWIHDYHLMLTASYLRELGFAGKTGFFLHIPFPSLDMFLRLPWRAQILTALTEHDLVGFQTMRDRRSFVHCIRAILGDASYSGRGQVCGLTMEHRALRIGAFPISIDFNYFAERAKSDEVAECAWQIHANLPDRQLILGVDRLDYSKGIPHRIDAFGRLLERHPEWQNRVSLVQIVVPSRRGIPEYEALKTEIERIVGEVNGRFTQRTGWVPVHYIYRSLSQTELIAYYRTAEIALLTPLKDGMNLVAKEYCAANTEETGVLVLSEFAGAAAELEKAVLLVNPHDVIGIAETLHVALSMPENERRRRMKSLRQIVRRHDVFRWVDSFLSAAFAKDLDSFPIIDELPTRAHPSLIGGADESRK